MSNQTEIKLTSYSHGAGCGCKISPAVLDEILGSSENKKAFKELIVGNETKDDAAVYDLGDGNALISTTDFFTPIVDDPFLFGQIASVNAISDIYAMGGKPIFALAILGWPISKIPASFAKKVIEGARNICNLINIPLAGGHSIDALEPFYGLVVNGIAPLNNIKKNSTAKIGDSIFITKKIGVGILSTAEKKGIISDEDKLISHKNMLTLNNAGEILGSLNYVSSMTDVTGFGLAGHLLEVCESSNTSAKLKQENIPLLCSLEKYINENAIPGGTNRNWSSYGNKITSISKELQIIISDPQTSGGLLFTIPKNYEEEFLKYCERSEVKEKLPFICKIGKMVKSEDKKLIFE